MVRGVPNPNENCRASRRACKRSHRIRTTSPTSLVKDDPDFMRLIRGKIIVEIAELAGLSKADVDVIKRMITRRKEEWTEKYETLTTSYLRRCMFFASTNKEQFLPEDETGQRRWLPVEIELLDDVLISRDLVAMGRGCATMARAQGRRPAWRRLVSRRPRGRSSP